MIDVIRFDALGQYQNGWLSARHHFSFGEYYDPKRMGFGPLRVWNDDTIQPQTGFAPHPHRDMEIVTYVRRGAISHRDNQGNEGRTVAGDVQVMSAGTGIVHSEYNLESEETQIFQIWFLPAKKSVTPRWETKAFPSRSGSAKLEVLASGRPGDQSADVPVLYQDVALLAANMNAGQSVTHTLDPTRGVYLVPARGTIRVNGEALGERDGAFIQNVDNIQIDADADAEIVLADVPLANWVAA